MNPHEKDKPHGIEGGERAPEKENGTQNFTKENSVKDSPITLTQEFTPPPVFDVCLQFDDDEPKVVYQNVTGKMSFFLEPTSNQQTSSFIFTDNITKKTFKLFLKKK